MMIILRFSYLLLFVTISVHADNGNRLAYLNYDGDYWQVFVNDESGQVKQLTKSDYDKSVISWFDNGDKIFACGIQSDAEIIDVKTGISEKISLPKTTVNDAVMSPDGKSILYSYIAKDSTDNKLWLYDLRTKSNQPLLVSEPGRQYDPKWSVAGDSFYFTTGFANKSYSIAKASPNLNNVDVIIQNGKLNLDVDADRNGNIVYSSNVNNTFNIWAKQGLELQQLTESDEANSHPSWSENSKEVYYAKIVNGVSNIWRLNIKEKGSDKQITDSVIGARYPVVLKMAKH